MGETRQDLIERISRALGASRVGAVSEPRDQRDLTERVARALGASRVVTLDDSPSRGPLDLLHLPQMVAQLREQPPPVECQLEVSAQSWSELEALATEMRAEGQEVSPELLARLVLERGVKALRESRRKSG